VPTKLGTNTLFCPGVALVMAAADGAEGASGAAIRVTSGIISGVGGGGGGGAAFGVPMIVGLGLVAEVEELVPFTLGLGLVADEDGPVEAVGAGVGVALEVAAEEFVVVAGAVAVCGVSARAIEVSPNVRIARIPYFITISMNFVFKYTNCGEFCQKMPNLLFISPL
jgi:hypothetical protein